MLWFFFFFKQKTAYEMRISYWSSDVCSSDLDETLSPQPGEEPKKATRAALSSTARVANVPVGRRARSSGASGSRPPVPAVRGGAGDDRSLSGSRRERQSAV